MKKRNNLIRSGFLALALAAAALLLQPGPVSFAASGQEEINDSKKKISDNKEKMKKLQNEKYQVDAKLKELNQLKNDAANYIKKLDGELAEIAAAIEDLEGQMQETENEIVTTQAELEAARAAEREQYASMKLRIRYMYEHGSESLLDQLLKAGNLSDMLNKAEYIENVSVYDRNKLDEYMEIREAVAAKEEQLESEYAVLEQTKAEVEERKASTEKLQADKTSELNSYKAKIQAAENEAAEMQKNIAGIQAAIRAEENNIAAIEARIRREEEEARRRAEAEGKEFKALTIGNISFSWPIPGQSRITSGFGTREAPTKGASTTHKGIDVGAPTGSKVTAAASGTVVLATYSSSAGNYIMISHGGGAYTVYMHLSKMSVSEGASVNRGDKIGEVGSTGYSTGPHLHFGIRVNGNYVNPMNYVSP